jgi:hypothetical protein
MNRDIGIGAIVCAAKHLLDLRALDFALEHIKRGLQVAADVFALLGPFEQHTQIVNLLDQ